MRAAAVALKAIKAAVRAGAWRPDPHLLRQLTGVELVIDATGDFVVIITAFVKEKRP